MVTDLSEVFRLGTEKAAENLAFRRYLHAHHHSDQPFQILASEVQAHMDCTQCANCCRYSEVSITPFDINRIAEYLGTTPAEIVRLYTKEDPEGPALRLLKNSQDGCVFLDGNLCMIYDARPQTCRTFPHVAVGEHSLGARPSSIGRWAALCPIIYNAIEEYKHLTGYHPHGS
jgi:uncharacterized protein